MHIIDAIAPEWKKLGIALKFESAKLSAIERSRFYQVNDCCLEMLGQWLEGSTCDHGKTVTWKTLLQAMMAARCSLSIAVKVWRTLSDEGSNFNFRNIVWFFGNNLCVLQYTPLQFTHCGRVYVFVMWNLMTCLHACTQGYAFDLVSGSVYNYLVQM